MENIKKQQQMFYLKLNANSYGEKGYYTVETLLTGLGSMIMTKQEKDIFKIGS
jgi:hypothetical protein